MTSKNCNRCKSTQLMESFFNEKKKELITCFNCRDRDRLRRAEKKKTSLKNDCLLQMSNIVNISNCDGRSITLTETVDKKKLAYIIEHPDDFNIGNAFVSGRKTDKNGQLTLLTKYYESLDNTGSVETSYHQHNGFGRYWTSAKFGLQNMSSKVRQTVSKDFCYDIDMANAHPTFLLHYCTTNKLPCEGINEYVNNRDNGLHEYMHTFNCKRGIAKVAYLEVTNGKVRYDTDSLPPTFLKYYMNIRDILDRVMILEPELKATAVRNKTFYNKPIWNVEGSVINYVMTSLENKCLMVIYDYLQHKNIGVASLIFDGLMIYKNSIDHNDLPILLSGCQDIVLVKTGITLSMTEKVMDEGYDIDVTDYIPNIIDKPISHQAVDVLFGTSGSEYITTTEIPATVKYVEDIKFENGCKTLIIKSPLGSGKTTALCRYIDENKFKRVLVVSPRQSFASSITVEYNEKIPTATVGLGESPVNDRFVCYLDVKNKKSLSSFNRLVISMESLHYLDNSNSFDLLVVDECQANLVSHTCVPTNGSNMTNNVSNFIDFINSSSRCVFADAFINDKTLNYLHHNQIHTHMKVYLRPMERRSATQIIGNDLDSLLSPLITSLEKGENNYVFVSSKNRAIKWATAIKEKFPEKKVLCYTGGEGGTIKNVREEWGDANVVITTATITVGINFDTKDWFHNVFISVSARACNLVSDVFQSHYRVRHLINKQMFFHISPISGQSVPTHYESLMTQLDWTEATLIEKTNSFSSAPLSIKQLAIDNKYEENISIMCLSASFYRYLHECNYTVTRPLTVCETDETLDIDEVLEIDLTYSSLKLLNIVELYDLQQKRNGGTPLTKHERAEIQKYIFTNCFSSDGNLIIDPTHVERLWNVWIDFGKGKILSIRKEKKLINQRVTLSELFEEQADHCSFAALQDSRNIKIEWILNICKYLGVQHSQDTETSIPKYVLDKCIEEIRPTIVDMRNAFSIRVKRNDVNHEMPFRGFIDLLNSIFKEHGFTKLVATGPARIRCGQGGKMSNPNQTYNLVANSKHDTPDDDKICDIVYKLVDNEEKPRFLK